MSKLNKILIALLIVQLLITGYAFWPRSVATGGGPLLADFAPGSVVRLTITDNNGDSVTLAKNGDNWLMPDAADFPVISDTVKSLLDKIEKVKTGRLVTRTEASHKRLQVATDDYARLVELEMADGRTDRLYVGSSAGAGATHVRLNDQPEVYLTADLTSFDANAQASHWIDTTYVDVPADDIEALTLENGNGSFEFNKKDAVWQMTDLADGETFNTDAWTALLNQIHSIRMNAPLGKTEETSYGLDAPLATVTFKTKDDKSYTLQVGAEKDNGYIFKSSESPYYVVISQATGNTLINKTRDDFLQKAEATEPAAGNTNQTN